MSTGPPAPEVSPADVAAVRAVLADDPDLDRGGLEGALRDRGTPLEGWALRAAVEAAGYVPERVDGLVRFRPADADDEGGRFREIRASMAFPAGGAGALRLRDQPTTVRWAALAVALLLAVPVVAGLLGLVGDGAVLTGDQALLGVRSLDVLGGDPPLVGQPSTSEVSGGGVRTYHPGPIEMYAFAPLVAVLGGWGMVVGAGLANLGCLLLTAWVALRRAGPWAALVVVVLLALLERSMGASLLVDPLSSNMWAIPLVAVLACCWAVAQGDLRLLPVTALVASWAAQQHLSAVLPTLSLVLFALAVLGVGWVRARRAGVSRTPVWPWLGSSVLVGLGCWLPVAIQQATGNPGNLTAVLEYSQAEGRTTTGLSEALGVTTHALWPVPVLLRTDVVAEDLLRPAGDAGVVLALAVGAALVMILHPGVARATKVLLGAALVLSAAGVVNTSNIPGSTGEALRLNHHRWTWTATTALLIGLVWGAATLLRPVVARRAAAISTRAPSRLGPAPALALVVAVVGIAAVASILVVPEREDAEDDPYASDLAQRTITAVERDAGGAGTVLLIPEGPAAELSITPAVTFALEDDGHQVLVPRRFDHYWGGHRAADGDTGEVAYRISSRGTSPAGPRGTLVARLLVDPDLEETTEVLEEELAGTELVINPRGDQLLSLGAYQRAVDTRAAIAAAPEDPFPAVLDPAVVSLMVNGGVDGVDVEPGVLQRHLEVLAREQTVWTQRHLYVFRLTPDEARTILDLQPEEDEVLDQPR